MISTNTEAETKRTPLSLLVNKLCLKELPQKQFLWTFPKDFEWIFKISYSIDNLRTASFEDRRIAAI